ncbi:ELAV-like protein 1 [Drosophila grimshawi]|uniref:GH18205 n=1 Tax=Drosophila grimshawi TaxID=7222 RepID=B4JFU3_DROGR|nr:ELAV-like protein 1 [Drosophila grimshawi]XP_032593291.1 ELAV-like protein 1 [Drosophila grimshawi]EDV93574.1 GH18205 [Drosophila grimshawi]
MPQNMDEDELNAMFNIFGPIARSKVVRQSKTHKSLCYGFVQFEAAENAMLAQISLNGRSLRGKRNSEIKHATVFVTNLPNDEQQNFAFISFVSRFSAALATSSMHGYQLENCLMPVMVKLATRSMNNAIYSRSKSNHFVQTN